MTRRKRLDFKECSSVRRRVLHFEMKKLCWAEGGNRLPKFVPSVSLQYLGCLLGSLSLQPIYWSRALQSPVS